MKHRDALWLCCMDEPDKRRDHLCLHKVAL